MPHLFHGTVEENIRLARAEATREEIMGAAHLAQAHDFIRKLPQGYGTPIGDRGARLSGGQAQRIALARAFLKDAPLLILDEPTSELDPEHESLIRQSMKRLMKGRTVLIIAHRLSTVFDADKIILLSAGKIVEQGTHAGLMTRGRLYASLVEAYGGAP
jgi:ABC-type multidrug transport system fused ATPase/permease subunit